ncbi:MAG: leucine-rich repeat domain-containing protein [Ardenticatenaceae bacterium]|nr:leucine-rich repeat domain-containing protein [Ardenticatenaceae bacterium]
MSVKQLFCAVLSGVFIIVFFSACTRDAKPTATPEIVANYSQSATAFSTPPATPTSEPTTPGPVPIVTCTDGTEVTQNEYEALLAFSPINNEQPPNPSFSWIVAECTNQHITGLSWHYLEGKYLPPEIGSLPYLTTLNIQGRDLSSLPPEIGNLTNLTILSITSENLTSLPPEIGNLTNLSQLDLLSNVNLTSLPPEIGNLTNLNSLSLSGNNVSSLPPEIGNLTNLTLLSISSENLTSLPRKSAI